MKIAIAEAKAQFAEIIRRAEAGEEIELTRHGRSVARIVGPAPVRRVPLIGCMAGRIHVSSDPRDGDAEVAALFSADGAIFPAPSLSDTIPAAESITPPAPRLR